MMECSIGVKLFCCSVLVSGQQLTQIKTFRVRICGNVKRETLWFANTEESAIKLLCNLGRRYCLHPEIVEGILCKFSNRKVACWISIKRAVFHSAHRLGDNKQQEWQEKHGAGLPTIKCIVLRMQENLKFQAMSENVSYIDESVITGLAVSILQNVLRNYKS